MAISRAQHVVSSDTTLDEQASDHSSTEERDRLMTILRMETGHNSFGSYLGLDDEEYGQQIYAWLSPFLAKARQSGFGQPSLTSPCTIYDLKEGEDSALTLDQRCCESSPTRVVQSLRAPPANVCTQILLCPHLFNRDCIETFGLALGLRREYLKAVFEAHPARSANMPQSMTYNRETYAGRYLHSQDFVTMGEAVATVCHEHTDSARKGISTVIIVGAMESYEDIHDLIRKRDNSLEECRVQWATCYQRTLEGLLKWPQIPMDCISVAPLIALLPLLSMNAFYVRRECWRIRNSRGELMRPFRNELPAFAEPIKAERLHLRTYIEAMEDAWMRFIHYLMVNGMDLRQDPRFSFSGKAYEDEIDAARRLEGELRDYLQLEVGELALQESKKSIDISNFQIQEGKRGQSQCRKVLSVLF